MYAGASEPASKSVCAIVVLAVGSLVVTGAVVGALAYVAVTQLGDGDAGGDAATPSQQQQESLTQEQGQQQDEGGGGGDEGEHLSPLRMHI